MIAVVVAFVVRRLGYVGSTFEQPRIRPIGLILQHYTHLD